MGEKKESKFSKQRMLSSEGFFQSQVNAQSYRVVFVPNSRKQREKY